MTIIKNIFIIILILLSFVAKGQIDTTKHQYEYEICVYYQPKEKSRVLKNKKYESVDTTVTFIRGTIYNYKRQPLYFAPLHLTSLTDSSKYGTNTDSLGDFKLYLPSDKYKLSAFYVGYSNLIIDEIQFRKGEFCELQLQLGAASGFQTYSILTNQPLSKRELDKIEKRLRRKGEK